MLCGLRYPIIKSLLNSLADIVADNNALQVITQPKYLGVHFVDCFKWNHDVSREENVVATYVLLPLCY